MSGARQSKRLRLARETVVTKQLTVTKSMTVKEIKVALQKELGIPTICQRLFYGSQELEDNTATVASSKSLPTLSSISRRKTRSTRYQIPKRFRRRRASEMKAVVLVEPYLDAPRTGLLALPKQRKCPNQHQCRRQQRRLATLVRFPMEWKTSLVACVTKYSRRQ
ncbi:hypothetical protein B0H14DRAFT_22558 [Mycena olivaceomarginata]|nr:hypothetical protein B0H14DRAFT_22558 [Mycena olivaceomarginata]